MPSRIKMRARAASSVPTPGQGETIFLDSADDALKTKDTEGAVSSLGAGGGAAAEGTVVENLTGTQTTYGQLFRGDAEPTDPAPVEGDLWIDTTGGLPYQLKNYNGATWDILPLVAKDALGAVTALVTVGDGLVAASVGDRSVVIGTSQVEVIYDVTTSIVVGANGISLVVDGAELSLLSADGSVWVRGLELDSGGNLDFQGGGNTLLNLPTADPAVAGALWNDAGVVKVSA